MRAGTMWDENGGGGQGGMEGPVQGIPLCYICRQVLTFPGLSLSTCKV